MIKMLTLRLLHPVEHVAPFPRRPAVQDSNPVF
jgi:hypothetical protein